MQNIEYIKKIFTRIFEKRIFFEIRLKNNNYILINVNLYKNILSK